MSARFPTIPGARASLRGFCTPGRALHFPLTIRISPIRIQHHSSRPESTHLLPIPNPCKDREKTHVCLEVQVSRSNDNVCHCRYLPRVAHFPVWGFCICIITNYNDGCLWRMRMTYEKSSEKIMRCISQPRMTCTSVAPSSRQDSP